MWGLGRVAAAETPELRGGLLDVTGDGGGEGAVALGALASVLGGGHGETELALRPGGLFARRLLRDGADPAPESDPGYGERHGTVLITGGTGALGARVARWYAERGAEHLLLLSRGGPDADGAKDLAEELAGHGARVTVAACDAADRDRLAEVVAAVPAGTPVTAVVHAAGALDDCLVGDITPERLESVLRPKTAAIALHDLTAGLPVREFVLFSSVAAVVGAGGQGSYAAANAYLDAFAEWRRGTGLPATAIAWGPWDGGGMAHRGVVDRRARRAGLRPSTPAPRWPRWRPGCAVAKRIASSPTSTGIGSPPVSPTAGSPLSRGEIPEARAVLRARPAASEQVQSGPLAGLAGASRAERTRILTATVRAEAAFVLGHDSPAAFGADQPLSELGFDSLLSLELRNRLGAATGLALPASLVFDHPTLTALVENLLERLGGTGEQVDAEAGDERSAPAVRGDEPIAIIGIGCRFPGGLDSPEALWRALDEGGDLISGFPADRDWDLDSLYDPDPAHPGTSYVREGGFLEGAAEFDAELFGISPREALAMDPQQRILLETVWEALERARIDARSLRGGDTGVFVGASTQGYAAEVAGSDDDVGGYLATGNAGSVMSGRLAYAFGLEGPAVTVDTACSSSLVALHLAAQSLRGGECSLALARRRHGDGDPGPVRGVQPGSAGWPRTAGARRSRTPRTAPAGARARACSSSNACPTPAPGGTGSWRCCAAPRSTPTAPPTG
nr:type I polyketide synthase [Actinomadura madurae]